MPHQDLIVDGRKWPSVTEVLSAEPKPWLNDWYLKWGTWADRKTNAATAIGREFHWCLETGNPGTGRVKKMVENFEKWAANARLGIAERELHVVSKQYGYHGTFDAIGTMGRARGLVLFDWKTSASIYPDMALQLAAYAQAYKEETGVEIRKGVIVLVSKDKPYHKVITAQYILGKRLFGKFIKKLDYYNAHVAIGKTNG